MKGKIIVALFVVLCLISILIQIVAIENLIVQINVLNAYLSDFVFFMPTKIIIDYEVVANNQVPIAITVDNIAFTIYADGAVIGMVNLGPKTLNPGLNSFQGSLTLSVPQTLAHTMAGRKVHIEIRVEKTIRMLWIIPIYKTTKTYHIS